MKDFRTPEFKTLEEAVDAANAAIEEFDREHAKMKAAAEKLVDALLSPEAEKKIARLMAPH